MIYDEEQNWIGVEVGIETGSARLARSIMPAKAAPYPVEMWPEVVEEAFAIMHDHRIVPAATLILGLPDEEEEDLTATLELLDRLEGYRSLIVPMFFVPLGALKDRRWFLREQLNELHVEVLKKCMWHTVRWGEDIMSKLYLRDLRYAPVKMLLKLFLAYVKRKAREAERVVEEMGLERVKRGVAIAPTSASDQ